MLNMRVIYILLYQYKIRIDKPIIIIYKQYTETNK